MQKNVFDFDAYFNRMMGLSLANPPGFYNPISDNPLYTESVDKMKDLCELIRRVYQQGYAHGYDVATRSAPTQMLDRS